VEPPKNDRTNAVARLCLALESFRRTEEGRVRDAKAFLAHFFPGEDRLFCNMPKSVRADLLAGWGIRGKKSALRDDDARVRTTIQDALAAGDIDDAIIEEAVTPDLLIDWVPLPDWWRFWRAETLPLPAVKKALGIARSLSLFDEQWFLAHLLLPSQKLSRTDVVCAGLSKLEAMQWLAAVHASGDASPAGLVTALGWDTILDKTAHEALLHALDALARQLGLASPAPAPSDVAAGSPTTPAPSTPIDASPEASLSSPSSNSPGSPNRPSSPPSDAPQPNPAPRASSPPLPISETPAQVASVIPERVAPPSQETAPLATSAKQEHASSAKQEHAASRGQERSRQAPLAAGREAAAGGLAVAKPATPARPPPLPTRASRTDLAAVNVARAGSTGGVAAAVPEAQPAASASTSAGLGSPSLTARALFGVPEPVIAEAKLPPMRPKAATLSGVGPEDLGVPRIEPPPREGPSIDLTAAEPSSDPLWMPPRAEPGDMGYDIVHGIQRRMSNNVQPKYNFDDDEPTSEIALPSDRRR
jgi:hypothetical protein